MPNLIFPASPTIGDTFTHGDATYQYDGGKWKAVTQFEPANMWFIPGSITSTTYNGDNDITKIIETVDGDARITDYTYDAAKYLVSVVMTFRGWERTETFNYDGNYNLIDTTVQEIEL